MNTITTDDVLTLYCDDSVRKKLTVMSRWDAMLDDARNPTSDFAERVVEFLRLGQS